MITKDEKRFLKWLLIAALLGIVIWQLTQRGVLSNPGEGVFLVSQSPSYVCQSR